MCNVCVCVCVFHWQCVTQLSGSRMRSLHSVVIFVTHGISETSSPPPPGAGAATCIYLLSPTPPQDPGSTPTGEVDYCNDITVVFTQYTQFPAISLQFRSFPSKFCFSSLTMHTIKMKVNSGYSLHNSQRKGTVFFAFACIFSEFR